MSSIEYLDRTGSLKPGSQRSQRVVQSKIGAHGTPASAVERRADVPHAKRLKVGDKLTLRSVCRAHNCQVLEAAMAQRTSYEADIRPLFTERDVQAMSKAFNLANYSDVKTHAAVIYDRIRGIGGAVMPPPPPRG